MSINRKGKNTIVHVIYYTKKRCHDLENEWDPLLCKERK